MAFLKAERRSHGPLTAGGYDTPHGKTARSLLFWRPTGSPRHGRNRLFRKRVNHLSCRAARIGRAVTEFVGESVDKGLAAEALPAGQLDKPEAAIIDQPARPQRLDSGAVQNHLGDLGFSATLGALWRGPAAAKEPFRRPAVARAVEGLLHVMGVLRERDEVRTGLKSGTRRPQCRLLQTRLDGAAARSAIERFYAQARPTIGMFPSVRIDGLASA